MKKIQVIAVSFIILMSTTGFFAVNAYLNTPIVVHIPMIIGSVALTETNAEAAKISAIADQIRNARPGQEVLIHINSYGGVVFNALEVINAMKATKGHTVAILDGAVISAGSMIALSAQEMRVEEHSVVLIHMASGGDPTNPILVWMNTEVLFNQIKDILTPEELGAVYSGIAWVAKGEVLKDRFDKLHKLGKYAPPQQLTVIEMVKRLVSE